MSGDRSHQWSGPQWLWDCPGHATEQCLLGPWGEHHCLHAWGWQGGGEEAGRALDQERQGAVQCRGPPALVCEARSELWCQGLHRDDQVGRSALHRAAAHHRLPGFQYCFVCPTTQCTFFYLELIAVTRFGNFFNELRTWTYNRNAKICKKNSCLVFLFPCLLRLPYNSHNQWNTGDLTWLWRRCCVISMHILADSGRGRGYIAEKADGSNGYIEPFLTFDDPRRAWEEDKA